MNRKAAPDRGDQTGTGDLAHRNDRRARSTKMISASATLNANSQSAKMAVKAASVGGTTITKKITNSASQERSRLSGRGRFKADPIGTFRPSRDGKTIIVPEVRVSPLV